MQYKRFPAQNWKHRLKALFWQIIWLPAAFLALASRTQPPVFVYTPNSAIVADGPRYPVKAAVISSQEAGPRGDFGPALGLRVSGQGTKLFRANLLAQGFPTWPRLTPKSLAQNFADELSASGLVASAAFADSWKAHEWAKLIVTVDVLQAELIYSDALTGRWNFTVRMRAYVQFPGNNYGEDVWRNTFQVQVPRSGRPPAVEINDALRQLYAQATQDMQQGLDKPEIAAVLTDDSQDPGFGL